MIIVMRIHMMLLLERCCGVFYSFHVLEVYKGRILFEPVYHSSDIFSGKFYGKFLFQIDVFSDIVNRRGIGKYLRGFELFEVFVYIQGVIWTVERYENILLLEDIENLRLEELERLGIELARLESLQEDIERDIFEFCEIESFFCLPGVKEWEYIVIEESEVDAGQYHGILFLAFGYDRL